MFIHDAFCSLLSSVGHCFWTFGVRKGVAILMAILIHYDAIEWCIRHTPLAEPISKSIIGFIYCILYLICYRFWKYIHMPVVFVSPFNIILFVHKEKKKHYPFCAIAIQRTNKKKNC